LSAQSRIEKELTKRKRAIRRDTVRESEDVMGSQSVETVPLSAVRQKARSARAGASGGGVAITAAFPSLQALTQKARQSYWKKGRRSEAGIVEAVQDAPDADKGPIRTREVPEDDVPPEYDDDGRRYRRLTRRTR